MTEEGRGGKGRGGKGRGEPYNFGLVNSQMLKSTHIYESMYNTFISANLNNNISVSQKIVTLNGMTKGCSLGQVCLHNSSYIWHPRVM